MLDGLDESINQEMMHEFITESSQFYEESTFVVLSREEGKEILRGIRDPMIEFSLEKFDNQQCKQFVDKFPFSGKDKANKRVKLSTQLENNFVIKATFSIPINAVMICRLFDDINFDGVVQSNIDMLKKLLALTTKAGMEKEISQKLETCKSRERRQSLAREKRNLVKTSINDVLSSKRHMLVKLGHAVFNCNGHSLIGFQRISQRRLEEELRLLDLTDDEISVALKLDIFEKIIEGEREMLHFYHRNIRELIVCLFAAQEDATLTPQDEKSNLKDAHISVFRCAVALILEDQDKDPIKIKEKLLNVLKHIVSSCTRVDEWRLLMLIVEIFHLAWAMAELKVALHEIIMTFVAMAKERSFKINLDLVKAIEDGYLYTVANEHDINCQNCSFAKGGCFW